MTPQAKTLIDQAVAQELPRTVRDPVVLARIAAIVSGATCEKVR